MSGTRWSAGERAFMERFAPGHTYAEIAEGLRRECGSERSASSISNFLNAHGLRCGVNSGRFKPGDGLGVPKSAETRARISRAQRGRRPARTMPPGSESLDPKHEYVMVKVDWKNGWRYKHHIAWERAHGSPVPEGCQIVFLDGDRRNFDPGNLAAVPRGLMSTINRRGLRFHDRASLEACMAIARLEQAKNRKMREASL